MKLPTNVCLSFLPPLVFCFVSSSVYLNILPISDTFCSGGVGELINELFWNNTENDQEAFNEMNSTNAIYPHYRHYSMHDITEIAFGQCMGIPFSESYNTSYPNYAATYLIESQIDENDPEHNSSVFFLLSFVLSLP